MPDPITYPDDHAWVERICSGDADAWNRFVDRYSDRIWRRAWHLCDEACPFKHRRFAAFCVFHALDANHVQPSHDTRPGCDEGLEVYAFICEYFWNRSAETGKLSFYDGSASLDAFVAATLHGSLRTDWIRHHRGVRIDRIPMPPEIEALPSTERAIYEQMVLQRPAERIAREIDADLSIPDIEAAQERITHVLIASGNVRHILREPEVVTADYAETAAPGGRVVSLHGPMTDLWTAVGDAICDLPSPHRLVIDMVFDEGLTAGEVLDRVETLGLDLPVTPRSGPYTTAHVYQSIDALLKRVGTAVMENEPNVVNEARSWLPQDLDAAPLHVAGLKEMLDAMGVPPRPSAPRDGPAERLNPSADASL
ncbi:MAG: hypothetical protein GVY25_06705 [Bacteroidetes bacterium]|jgi:hypothetical protein|nr:hypothetical protein [Bacteroidota bacterium]